MLTDIWRKSTRSGGNGCVAVKLDGVVAVRDSKNPESPVLSFVPQRWAEFVADVSSGKIRR